MNWADILLLTGIIAGVVVCLMGVRARAVARAKSPSPKVEWSAGLESLYMFLFPCAGEAFASFFLRFSPLAIAIGAALTVMTAIGGRNRLVAQQKEAGEDLEVAAAVLKSYGWYASGQGMVLLSFMAWQWLRFFVLNTNH